MEKEKENLSKIDDSKLLNKKRSNGETKDQPLSKKKQLVKQLEFYFSDINLMSDKFLRNILIRDPEKGVEITVIQNFNKIIEILKGIPDMTTRINYIKKAVIQSKSLKLNTRQNKILRTEKYNESKIDKSEIDDCTVYVENLPGTITHELLTQIFSRCGQVLLVSIPKFADKTVKGFAFITFSVRFSLK